jgi:aminoglycoside phosphotransferase (APT) family kinase protein
MKGYLDAAKVFNDFGLSVPHLVANGNDKTTGWILEEFVEGSPVRELPKSAENLETIAFALASLHSHQQCRYGRVGGFRGPWAGGWRLGQRWKRRLPGRWQKILRLFPELVECEENVFNWFETWADQFDPPAYQLLHGDIHPGNLILRNDRQVVFLDARSPRYGFGLVELIEAAHHFLGEEPDDWVELVDPYLAQIPKPISCFYQEQHKGIHAVFHLRHADRFASLALSIERGTTQNHRCWEENAWDSWLCYCELAQISSPPRVGLTPDNEQLVKKTSPSHSAFCQKGDI